MGESNWVYCWSSCGAQVDDYFTQGTYPDSFDYPDKEDPSVVVVAGKEGETMDAEEEDVTRRNVWNECIYTFQVRLVYFALYKDSK